MELIMKQAYLCYAEYLGNKIIEWVDKKPKNKELRNVLKATKEVLNYNVQLEIENAVLKDQLDFYKNRRYEELKQ